LLLAPVLLFLASAGAKPRIPAHVPVARIAARPEDVGSLDGIIKAYYEVVSGPAGQPRQWARDRSLYIPQLHFVEVDRDRKSGAMRLSAMNHQEYVDKVDPGALRGFFEREIHRTTQSFGAVTHVWSTYESRAEADGPVIARGINSIEVIFDGKRYWITFAQWDEETPDQPLPQAFLP
jgi:hypothetical protein